MRPAADFLLIFRDQTTGLPQPSHDLWEEKYGVFLFTCASVYAALRAAAACAEALGLPAAASYAEAADEVRAGVATHFYDPQLGRFVFMVHMEEDGTLRRDPTLDSSMAGVFLFGLFPATDPRVVATMLAVQAGLQNHSPIGGIARHGADYYHHIDGDYAHYQGNTWFVSTLWLADWFSACGDRRAAATWIEWCAERALPSGVLAEQLHPYTGQPLSVSPLTWSHAPMSPASSAIWAHQPASRPSSVQWTVARGPPARAKGTLWVGRGRASSTPGAPAAARAAGSRERPRSPRTRSTKGTSPGGPSARSTAISPQGRHPQGSVFTKRRRGCMLRQ